MKNIKLFFGFLLTAITCFLMNKAGAGDDLSIFAMTGIAVASNDDRGYLALFVEYLKKKYGHSDLSTMDLKPANCRLLVDLSNGISSYTFNLRQKYRGDTASLKAEGAEIILDEEKDYFFPKMRIATRKDDTANKVLGPVFTYEDKAHHDDATGIGEVASLHALYNGNIVFKSGSTTRIDKLLMDNFRVVPAQQKEEASDVLTFWPEYGPTDQEKGYVAIPPTLIIDSKDTNELTVNLTGPYSAIAGASNKKNILQIDFKGWVYNHNGSTNGFCGV